MYHENNAYATYLSTYLSSLTFRTTQSNKDKSNPISRVCKLHHYTHFGTSSLQHHLIFFLLSSHALVSKFIPLNYAIFLFILRLPTTIHTLPIIRRTKKRTRFPAKICKTDDFLLFD